MRTGILWMIAGAGLGALAGWLYWRYVGCSTGTCPITSRPLSSALYGALIGLLLASYGVPAPASKNTKHIQQQTKRDDRDA